MKVQKVLKIKKTGILHDFNNSNLVSPDLDFKQVNLIFGWNGTGKTTLSRILRCYEMGEVGKKLQKYSGLGCEIELYGGTKLSEVDFTTKQQIRVFNKDFVDENIFQDKEHDGANVRALFYLGKEVIELTKERKDKSEKETELSVLQKDTGEKIRGKEKFEKDTAKEIKDALLGIKEFQHYHSNSFRESINDLKSRIARGEVEMKKIKISEDDFDKKLKTVKSFEALDLWISDIKTASAKIDSVYVEAFALVLEETVSISKSVEKLKTDYELSDWVQSGISIHKHRASAECEFCGQTLPAGRINLLEGHFNEDYKKLSDSISGKIEELKSLKIKEEDKIPDEDTKEIASRLNGFLDEMIIKVESKQRSILLKEVLTDVEKAKFVAGFKNINDSAENTIKRISGIAKELELSLLSDHFNEYNKKNDDIEANNLKKIILESDITTLDVTIKKEEKSIKDFKLPAEQVNEDLQSFLGHPELKFEDREDAYGEVYYEITRNGDVAFNLSEGEKTAISLIYFLRKLSEDGFDMANGLVFIDDPISSMDSQFLYSAYAFIVAAIEEETAGVLKVGQLFLSTHNYDFFNLFKKKYWKNTKDFTKRRCELYMLKVKLDSTAGRCSNIYELDKLLKNYDSDYQYLYSKLVDFENADEAGKNDLEKIYGYPNIARRVLETFLSFKFPAKVDFQAKFNAISVPGISKEVKESVYRFVNIKSHGTIKEIEGFSPEILEPTAKDHILNVLKIMRELDSVHCSEIESTYSS